MFWRNLLPPSSGYKTSTCCDWWKTALTIRLEEYTASCQSSKVYIGQVTHTIRMWCKAHVQHIQTKKSVLTEHRIKAEFRISFQNITVLARPTGHMDHLVKEATEIWLHQNNFNSDLRFTLSCSQYTATCLFNMEGPSKTTVMKHQWQSVTEVMLRGSWWLDGLTPPTVTPAVCTGTGHHQSHDCPLFHQFSTLGQNTTDCLNPPTVPSMVHAKRAKSLFCNYKYL
jgi:hypothetical protein